MHSLVVSTSVVVVSEVEGKVRWDCSYDSRVVMLWTSVEPPPPLPPSPLSSQPSTLGRSKCGKYFGFGEREVGIKTIVGDLLRGSKYLHLGPNCGLGGLKWIQSEAWDLMGSAGAILGSNSTPQGFHCGPCLCVGRKMPSDHIITVAADRIIGPYSCGWQ